MEEEIEVDISADDVSMKRKTPSCSVCGENPSKYRCPRCFVETCCLTCVKQHKQNTNCSGIRDKTGYVAVKSFTDTHLLNDYRFLEEGGRRADNACRDFLPKCKRIPKRLHQLVKQARLRGIELKLLPYPMTKRKINSTFYMFRKKQIMWHIEWCFPQAGETFTDKLVKESIPLGEELEKYIHPTDSDPIKRHKLQEYVQAGLESCYLFMKVEGLPANKVRFHRLEADKSINDNLTGKCVLEFPKIFVVLTGNEDRYRVITKDEEEALCKSIRRYNIHLNKTVERKCAHTEELDKTSSHENTSAELQTSCD